MESPKPKREVLEAAVILLARREYCRYDLAQKLKQKGYTIADIKKALTWAVQNNYINEERYAGIYIQTALEQKHQGKKRIFSDLSFKHIPDRYIQNAWDTYYNPQNEHEALRELIVRRLHGDDSPKSKNRVIRYLLSHGYEFSTIKAALEEVLH